MGTNAVQAFGATITYFRRYLYMLALDICEPDSIDPITPAKEPTPVVVPPALQKKETPAQPLTDNSSNASELQIKQLKEVLKKLLEADPSKAEMVEKLAIETNGFTTISKVDCEAFILNITAMLNGGDAE